MAKEASDHVMHSICLSGEGRARVTTSENRNVARYESLFDTTKRKFLFTIDVPGKGEELLELSLPQTEDAKAQARGTFLKNLDLKDRKSISDFVHKLSTVLEIHSGDRLKEFNISCQTTDNGGICLRRDEAVMTWRKENDKLMLLIPGQQSNLNLLGENFADGHYQKVTMEFLRGSQQKSELKIELFLTNCK